MQRLCALNVDSLLLLLQQFWIQIPLLSAKDQCDNLLEDGMNSNEDGRYEDTWEW